MKTILSRFLALIVLFIYVAIYAILMIPGFIIFGAEKYIDTFFNSKIFNKLHKILK